jgi:hypothetical protein
VSDLNNELADLLEKVAKKLREENKPLPADFQRVVDENFWKLLGEPPKSRPVCDACRNGGVCGCYQPEWDSPTCSVAGSSTTKAGT